MYAQFRRFIARLSGKTANRQGLYKLERMFAKAAKASNSPAQAQKSPTTTSGAQYHAPGSSESISIKDQIRTHLDELNAMESVDAISYETTTKETMRNRVISKFQRLGGKIDRKNFGIIEIGAEEVKTASNYVETQAEIAAWSTVPRVLKRGILIHTTENHKDRGHPTFTIAAPVTINGTRGIVAVIVKKTGRNRYKSHRIVMPDGSAFTFEHNKNAESTGSDMLAKDSDQGPDINSASDYSIPDSSEKSNTNFSQPDPVTDAVFEEAPATNEPATPTTQWSFPVTPSNSQPVSGSMTERVVGDVEKSGVGGVDVEKRYRLIAEQTQAAVSAKQEDAADDSPSLEELMDAFKASMEGLPYIPKTQQPPSNVESNIESESDEQGRLIDDQRESVIDSVKIQKYNKTDDANDKTNTGNEQELPVQQHHFASNKNRKYTPQFERIVSKYGLKLTESWNKERLHHLGRHPNQYHKWIHEQLFIADKKAKGDRALFLAEFEKTKQRIRDNEALLRKKGWK